MLDLFVVMSWAGFVIARAGLRLSYVTVRLAVPILPARSMAVTSMVFWPYTYVAGKLNVESVTIAGTGLMLLIVMVTVAVLSTVPVTGVVISSVTLLSDGWVMVIIGAD